MEYQQFALTSTASACVGDDTADAEVQVDRGEGRSTPCRCVVMDSVWFGSEHIFIVTGLARFGLWTFCLISIVFLLFPLMNICLWGANENLVRT